jgi:hypothetical protein
MRVGYESWSVEVSESWLVTEHPECLTLELSKDAALQLSSAVKTSGAVEEEDLLLFASENQQESWGEPRKTLLGEFAGIIYEYKEEETAWIRCYLRNASTLLFVTYNGEAQVAQEERAEVQKVLASLKGVASRGA